MFVTATDFNTPPYNIANIESNNSFQDFVDAAEEDVLRKLLGNTLYDDFIAGLDVDPVDTKWEALRDGADYQYKLKNYKWVGMKKMLIPYIFQQWIDITADVQSGIGRVKGKPENAKAIFPVNRIWAAYSDFANMVGRHRNQMNTLYGFLRQNPEDYQDFDFKCFEDPGSRNSFGL